MGESKFTHPLKTQGRDVVTGFEGFITGRSEWSTGCRTYCLAPEIGDDGAFRESQWFDEERIVTGSGPHADSEPRDPRADGESEDNPIGGPIPNRMPRK